MSWQERMCAFLLRRVLAPVLDPRSTQKLHESLDVSMQDGRYSLHDIALNVAYLKTISNELPFSIRSARIRRLTAEVALKEHTTTGDETQSSLTWRALHLGSTSASDPTIPKVSLVVNLEIEGISFEVDSLVEAFCEEDYEYTTKPTSFLSSYADAVLKSLQLSVSIKKLSIKFQNGDSGLELKCQSVSYKAVPNADPSGQAYATKLHKVLVIQNIDLLAGSVANADGDRNDFVAIARLEGNSRVALRVIEYVSSASRSQEEVRVENDLEVSFGQKLNLSVDIKSLTTLRSTLLSLPSFSASSTEDINDKAHAEKFESNAEDEEDMNTLSSIIKQYKEAREGLERNEYRGGILVPDLESEEGEMTFDAFFDANDSSVYRYSSVLRESVVGLRDTRSNLVQTSGRLHLPEIVLKVTFLPSANPPNEVYPMPREYVLLTAHDINLSATLMQHTKQYTLAMGNLTIEDSHVFDAIAGCVPQRRRVEIGRVLYFPTEAADDVVVDSPSISLTVSMNCEADEKESIDAALEIAPVEISYHSSTVQNLMLLFDGIRQGGESTAEDPVLEDDARTPPPSSKRFRFICSLIRIIISSSSEKWDGLHERHWYGCNSSYSLQPSLQMDAEHVSAEIGQHSLECDGSVTVRSAIFSVVTPMHSGTVSTTRNSRLDFLSIRAVSDENPIRVSVFRRKKGSDAGDHFPRTVPISTFKARQRDEESDERIEEVLFSQMNDVDRNTRQKLRLEVDRQIQLISLAAQSEEVTSIHIPELIIDLTNRELRALHKVLTGISSASELRNDRQTKLTNPDGSHRAVSIRLGRLALSIRDECREESRQDLWSTCFFLRADSIEFYVQVSNHCVACARFLSGPFLFCEDFNGDHTVFSSEDTYLEHQERMRRLHARCFVSEKGSSLPIVYSSVLFEPVSKSSPAVQFDLLNPSSDAESAVEKNVDITLYNITHRFNVDEGGWVQRLKNAVSLDADGNSDTKPKSDAEAPILFTQLTISVVDCNIDYLPPARFKTESRVIAKIGDLRFCSYIVSPSSLSQACSLFLGDSSVLLCSQRYSYHEEDKCHFGQAVSCGESMSGSVDLLRQLNYRTVLMLDSVNCVTALAGSHQTVEPPLRISVTAGEASLFTCKDSFAILLGTIGDLSTELTKLDEKDLEKLRNRAEFASSMPSGDSIRDKTQEDADEKGDSHPPLLDELKQQSVLKIAVGTGTRNDRSRDFLLDGYDWTTIDAGEVGSVNVPAGEEQVARWYTADNSDEDQSEVIAIVPGFGGPERNASGLHRAYQGPKLISHHFSLNPSHGSLEKGDMDAQKYAETDEPPPVSARVLVHDFALKLRCFDGYDWPELLSEAHRDTSRLGSFIIDDESISRKALETKNQEAAADNKKDALLSHLLSTPSKSPGTFKDVPLPEERSRMLKMNDDIRRLGRSSAKYVQFSVSSVNMRMDSFCGSTEHRLSSCVSLQVGDFFLAETISGSRPIKMAGEWVNEQDHPRDTTEGLISAKIVTWLPEKAFLPDGSISNDVVEVVLKLLPLRCFLDQRAIRFASSFFRKEEARTEKPPEPSINCLPPPLIRKFRARPFKLKVDYKPERLDTKALRDGALVELVNLNSLDGLVLTLEEVVTENVVGYDTVVGILTKRWLEDVCATQLVKFVTNARPFEPITTVTGGAADMIVLPWDAFQNGDSIQRALRAGASSFAKAIAYETLTLSSRLGQFLAETVAHATTDSGEPPRVVPSRPFAVPRTLTDTSSHAVESLSRGLQTAGYRIVIVPYREYHRSGATGAVRSVLKGIPVAIAAPTSGAAEAMSFALLGARNQIRPDIRKEDEASQRGLYLGNK